MSRIENLAQSIAFYVCNPSDSIEIGGVSSQLLDIVKIQTKGNKKLREKVREWIEFYIENGETTIQEYKRDIQEAFDDYDRYFCE